MTTKRITKNKTDNCERCGLVTSRAIYLQHFTDESPLPIQDRDILDRVLDYGSCQVAAAARSPGHPLADEIADCPVFGSR